MYLCWTLLLAFCTMVEHTRSAATLLPHVSTETQLERNTHNASSISGETEIFSSSSWPDDVQLGCKELRAKRFISDGFCTSLNPIKEVVCTGHCLPIKEQNMPWWAEFTKVWAKPKFKEWRCVEAVVKLKKVQLMCQNGETRTYKIKIVKSCRCKSYEGEHNTTDDIAARRGKRQNKNKSKDKERKRKGRRQKRQPRLRNKRNKNTKHERRRRQKSANSDSVLNSKSRRKPILENDSPSV